MFLVVFIAVFYEFVYDYFTGSIGSNMVTRFFKNYFKHLKQIGNKITINKLAHNKISYQNKCILKTSRGGSYGGCIASPR